MNTEKKLPSIRFAAMNYLALREHSQKELKEKLSLKFDNSEVVCDVVNELSKDGLQCDTRFTQAFVAMRKRQGKGPILVGLQLRERGVNENLIRQELSNSEHEWSQLASRVRVKKFGTTLPTNGSERAKQTRFLLSRGFSINHAGFAMANLGE